MLDYAYAFIYETRQEQYEIIYSHTFLSAYFILHVMLPFPSLTSIQYTKGNVTTYLKRTGNNRFQKRVFRYKTKSYKYTGRALKRKTGLNIIHGEQKHSILKYPLCSRLVTVKFLHRSLNLPYCVSKKKKKAKISGNNVILRGRLSKFSQSERNTYVEM